MSLNASATPARTNWGALFSLVGAMLLWGVIPTAVKYLLPYFSTTTINVWRLLAASLLFMLTVLLVRSWPKLSAREYLMLMLVGFLGTTMFQFTFINGVANSPAGVSSLTSSLNPVWVGLISAILGERLSQRRWFGIVLSVGGILIVSLKSFDPNSGVTLVGLGWLVSSSIVWALYTVFQRPWFQRISALQFNGVAFGLGSLPYIVFGMPEALTQQQLQAPLFAWLVMFASAIGGQYLGFLGWSQGVAAFGPTRTSVFLNLLPIIGLLTAFVFLGEPITWLAALATAVTLTGVYLTNSR